MAVTEAVADLTQAEDLAPIIQAYAEVAERLKTSHDVLTQEVCRLRVQLAEKDRQLERQERLAALGEMAAGVAHEIRNPLGGVGLYASLLAKDLQDRPEALSILEKMRSGVRGIERIVADILAFARGQEPTLKAVRLADLIERVMAEVAPHVEASGATVHVDARLADPLVWGDAGQLERALSNIILNALEACGDGGRVELACASGKGGAGEVAIVIQDDGPGIEAEQLDRVFNPFFTTKDQGTGLGLAIVHRIVIAHGGTVRVSNRPEGGARFVLTLPSAEASSRGEAAVSGRRGR
jgi:two-component system sensor histidine kinase HydH